MPPPTVIRNKQIMKKFKNAGAIGPNNAIAAEEVGLRDNMLMDRFVKLGFLAREGERYYVPEKYTKTTRWKMMFGKNA